MIYSLIAAAIGLLLISAGLKKKGADSKRSRYIDYSIGSILILLATINGFFLSPFKIPSESMVPVLNVGDYVFVKKWGIPKHPESYLNTIIVYKDPRDQNTYVKRIVAVNGDKLSWNGSTLMVNDRNIKVYKEECGASKHQEDALYAFMSENNIEGAWSVNEGVFAVGTNICKSMDSRSYGEIPMDNIIGTVVGVCSEKGCKTINEENTEQY